MHKCDNIKHIVEHVKSKIYKVKSTLKYGDVLELEARIGYIHDLQSNNRLFLETNIPTIYNLNKTCTFRAGANKKDYIYFLNEIKKQVSSEKEQTTFKIISRKDTTFKDRNFRYTQVDKKITEHIRKTKLAVFDIYNPNSVYDIRISLCKEEKMPISEEIPIKSFKRERNRISYVNSEGISYDFSNVKSTHLEENLEVEIEMTTFDEELKKVDTFFTKVFDFFFLKDNM